MELDVLCARVKFCVFWNFWHISARSMRKKQSNRERKKATFAECLAMIMVVTFLIEFRLPNFSPTVSRTRLESFSVNEK